MAVVLWKRLKTKVVKQMFVSSLNLCECQFFKDIPEALGQLNLLDFLIFKWVQRLKGDSGDIVKLKFLHLVGFNWVKRLKLDTRGL